MLHQLTVILLQKEILVFSRKCDCYLGNKHYNEIAKKFCCQKGNKKEFVLFLINPKNTAISQENPHQKLPKILSCRNGKSENLQEECPQLLSILLFTVDFT